MEEVTIEDESSKREELRLAMAFISPEAFVLFPLAIFLDILGFFDSISFAPDILGTLLIGGWIFLRSLVKGTRPTLKVTTQASRRINQAIKIAKKLRWLRPLFYLLEFVPVVGAFPWWTILVYFELKT